MTPPTIITPADALAPPSREYDARPLPVTRHEPSPWRHQSIAGRLAMAHDGFYVAHGMGSGKSRTTIDVLQSVFPKGRILVACPKAVVATWPHEIRRHAVDPDAWRVLSPRVGTVVERTAWLNQQLELVGPTRGAVVVVNYDVLFREPLRSWLAKQTWDCVVADEIHRIKSHTGVASKALAKIGAKAGKRLGLSGTPIPHSPLDLWAQFRFLDPSVFGTSFTAFRARYAVTHPMFPSKVDRWLRLEELGERFYSRAHRVRSEDVLDLPPTIDATVPVTLGSRARRAYDDLKDELVAAIDEAGGPDLITASNALVQLLRLQQITGGSVTTEGGATIRIDDAKAAALAEIVEDIGDEPVVVFCRFRGDIDQVREIAERAGIRFGELSGRANDLDGNRLGDDWGGRPGLFAVQTQSGGSGVDLTGAAACVYWSLGFSLGEYEQSRARTHRPGQTRTVRYWHLVAEGTVDETVYHALRNRAEVVGQVLRTL